MTSTILTGACSGMCGVHCFVTAHAAPERGTGSAVLSLKRARLGSCRDSESAIREHTSARASQLTRESGARTEPLAETEMAKTIDPRG